MTEAINLGALLGSGFGSGAGQAVGGTASAGGLFGALLATAEGSATDLEGLIASLATTQPTAQTDLSALLGAGTAVQAGEQPVLVTGEAMLVQVLVTRITTITQQLTGPGGYQFGAKGATGELATALTKLGLDPAEAEALATKIDTMLALLQQQADLAADQLNGEAGTSLVAVLLASMLNPAQAQTLQLPSAGTDGAASIQTLTQVQVVQTNVTVNIASWQAIQARAANTPSVSLLPAAEPTPMAAAAAPVLPTTPGKLQVLASVQTASEGTAATSAETSVRVTVAVAALATPIKQPEPGLTKRAAVSTPTVEASTAPSAVIGTVVYRLTESTVGAPVVQAVTSVAPESAALPKPGEGVAAAMDDTPGATPLIAIASPQLHNNPEPAAAPAASLAASMMERLYQAQQAQVGQQVQLAIQPLLNNGQGGTVRMTLNPPELGKLEVHLKIENGQVHGIIAARDSAVVEHLARELPALRQSLVDAGLKLGEQGLSLMLSNQQQPDQQTPQNPFAALPDERGRRQPILDEQGFGTISAEQMATGVMPGRWVAPTQLVDVAA